MTYLTICSLKGYDFCTKYFRTCSMDWTKDLTLLNPFTASSESSFWNAFKISKHTQLVANNTKHKLNYKLSHEYNVLILRYGFKCLQLSCSTKQQCTSNPGSSRLPISRIWNKLCISMYIRPHCKNILPTFFATWSGTSVAAGLLQSEINFIELKTMQEAMWYFCCLFNIPSQTFPTNIAIWKDKFKLCSYFKILLVSRVLYIIYLKKTSWILVFVR